MPALSLFWIVSILTFTSATSQPKYILGAPIHLNITSADIGNATSIQKFYFKSNGPLNITIPLTPKQPIRINTSITQHTIDFDFCSISGGNVSIFQSTAYPAQVIAVPNITNLSNQFVLTTFSTVQAFDPMAISSSDLRSPRVYQPSVNMSQIPTSFTSGMGVASLGSFATTNLAMWIVQFIALDNTSATWKPYAQMDLTSVKLSNFSVSGTWNATQFAKPQGNLLIMIGLRKSTNSSQLRFFGITSLYVDNLVDTSVVVGSKLNISFPPTVRQFDPLNFKITNGGVPGPWWILLSTTPTTEPRPMNGSKNYLLECTPQIFGSQSNQTGILKFNWRTAGYLVNSGTRSSKMMTEGGMALAVGNYSVYLLYSSKSPPGVVNGSYKEDLFLDSFAVFALRRELMVEMALSGSPTPIMLNGNSGKRIQLNGQSSVTLQVWSIFSEMYLQWAEVGANNVTTMYGNPINVTISQQRVLQNVTLSIPTAFTQSANNKLVRIIGFARQCGDMNGTQAHIAQSFVVIEIVGSGATKVSDHPLSTGAIVAIVLACLVAVGACVGLYCWFQRKSTPNVGGYEQMGGQKTWNV